MKIFCYVCHEICEGMEAESCISDNHPYRDLTEHVQKMIKPGYLKDIEE